MLLSILNNHLCLVISVQAPLHGHGGGEAPQVRPALAAGRQRHGQLHGVGREVDRGEDLLQDVRCQLQSCVVGPDGIWIITTLFILKRKYILCSKHKGIIDSRLLCSYVCSQGPCRVCSDSHCILQSHRTISNTDENLVC